MWKNGPIWSGGENFKRSISFAEFGVKIMPHVLFMQFEYPNWSGQMGWRPLMCYKFTMSSRLPRRLKHFIERADVAKREIRIQNLHTSWLSFKKTVLREVRTNIIKELLFIISTVRIQSEWDCSKLYVISGLSCSKEWLVPRRLKIVFSLSGFFLNHEKILRHNLPTFNERELY